MKTKRKEIRKVILELSTKETADLISALQNTHSKMMELTKDENIKMPTILAELEDNLNINFNELEEI